MNLQAKVLVLSQRDNVGTAAVAIEQGETFYMEGDTRREVTARLKIPFGFKVALVDISEGGDIFKYGEVIGGNTCPRPTRGSGLTGVESFKTLVLMPQYV